MKWTFDGNYMVRFERHDGKQKKIYKHREVWEKANGKIPYDMQIDHINRDKLDNRLENLRAVSRSVNQHNRKLNRNNTSGHKGVYWHKQKGKWHVQIMVNRVKKSLGLYDNVEDAANAYKEAAKCIQ